MFPLKTWIQTQFIDNERLQTNWQLTKPKNTSLTKLMTEKQELSEWR